MMVTVARRPGGRNVQLAARVRGLVELIRTNDLVLIGLIESLLAASRIPVFVADNHMSALEGSIGAFPRRLLVPHDRAAQARRLMIEAGLAAELRDA
jgi:hypothetical protein